MENFVFTSVFKKMFSFRLFLKKNVRIKISQHFFKQILVFQDFYDFFRMAQKIIDIY